MSEDRTEPVSEELKSAARQFMLESVRNNYSYQYEWMKRPIIQYPQDMVALQEIVWQVKPDLIVETGIAHGGSLTYSASLLALLDYCDALAEGGILDPAKPKRKVIGIDIDIRDHNWRALDEHPMRNRMELIEGSSIAPEIIAQVKKMVSGAERVIVCLDSNHSHDHVLAELNAYADLVSPGSYCIVFDTIIEDLTCDILEGLSWGVGNSPKSAVREFIKVRSDFIVDSEIDDKILISVAPNGFLKRTKGS